MSGQMALMLAENPSIPFVCFLGVGTVFVGLVCIIGIVELMTYLCNKFIKAPAPVKQEAANTPVSSSVIENRSEILAAVCAAVAEENGTDISAIRVVSFKKIN
jgi:Na+-transporting methylmalonyl-CoA/oxaloacetate decarboxylase gamma subunit